MPYQPTNPFPYNIAIDLQEGLQFRFKVDNYDTIESFQIDLYDLLKKERLYTIIRTIGDIQTKLDSTTGKEIKTLIEGDKQIIQIFDTNEEQVLLEEYTQGDSFLPLKGGFGDYSIGEVNLTNYIMAIEDIKKQQNYGNTPDFESLIITEETCFVIDEKGTIIEYIEAKNLIDKEHIVIPYIIGEIAVKNIGEAVFKEHTNITSVVVPACVASIGTEAFQGCANLEKVYLNYGNSTIKSYCFANCESLNSINILDSVTTIEDYAFYNCSSLNKIYLPWGLREITNYSFSGIAITRLELPKNIVSIGEEAFSNCSCLTEVICNKKLKTIGKRGFANCELLNKIVFNDDIQIIEQEAFLNANFKSLVIPNSIIKLGSGFLKGNDNIISLTVPFIGENNSKNEDKQSVLGHFFGESDTLSTNGVEQQYKGINTNYYLIPNTLKSITITQATFIPYGALSNCEKIQHVYMNEEITRIEDYAFYNCVSLTQLKLSSNINYIGNYAFALKELLISKKEEVIV